MNNDTADAQELKPCPFCGGEAQRVTLTEEDEPMNAGGDVITCLKCQASSHVEFGRKENLAECWNTRTTALPEKLDERIVHVSGTNPMSSETIQHLNVIANAACEAIHPAPSTSTPDEPASSIEFHQMRGRAADLIDWAINEYDGFMMDDDYDSQRLLDRIAERFRAFRHDNLETPHE